MSGEVSIIKGGNFSLDPGAAFGTTPRSVWSRYVSVNEQYRINMDNNLVFIDNGGKHALIDSGVGSIHADRFNSLFQVVPRIDLLDAIDARAGGKLDYVFHSHMHFDHAGNSEVLRRKYKGVKLVAQQAEKHEITHTNELTSVSYDSVRPVKRSLVGIDGSRRLNSWLSVYHTGGHTIGHQSIAFQVGKEKYLYIGDLAPSTFNLKPSRITAIDTYPMDSLKWKKRLIRKAIAESITCIFSHDTVTPAARISGTVEKFEITPVDLPVY
ncbi:MAG: MBL fold metallo-hydrolase [Candidatus Thermoplasmatota archaeon]|nr:MBL fold metallo-hydrolase [Candidatus Thermoplasmatota archaeon]MCL5438040.1 MBL fold metallo-hydrolase [Candidatus Thermoplasmatota archaeon]